MTDAAFVSGPNDGLAGAGPSRGLGQGLPDHLRRVRVDVEIVLGHLRMPLSDVAALSEGAVLALDRKLGDHVEIAINGRVVARGEVIAMEGEPDRLGVVIREMTASGEAAPVRAEA